MLIHVVVASKHGATRQIAEAIAEELGRAGHHAQTLDAADVETFAQADAVVLGSAVYAGRWLGPARALLEHDADELAARPTWLFSSGPVGDPPKPDDAEPVDVAESSEVIGARGHAVFAGRLDRSLLSRPERLVVRALRAPEGDFRDWDEIRAWARAIAESLAASPAGVRADDR